MTAASRVLLGATIFCVAAVLSSNPGAWAAGTIYEGNDQAYAGQGTQIGAWSQSARTVRLRSLPTFNMSNDRCMDAMVDWKVLQPVIGSNHYDSRVVRSCRPGFDEETDPGGNGKWSEPNGWGGRTPQGLHRGFGYIIDDDTRDVVSRERFSDSGSVDLPDRAPSTLGQGSARIRTLYQNGSRASCNPLPVGDPNFYGCD